MSALFRTYTARWIFPVSHPPIYRGWVRVDRQRILEIGRNHAPDDAVDLGDIAVLPGLVNAHTHLEFSDCSRPLGAKGIPLADWITHVISFRASTSFQEASNPIALGIRESEQSGVCLLGDIATTPTDLSTSDNMSVVSFAEVIGLSAERSQQRMSYAEQHILQNTNGAISPHAPYSTNMPAIVKCVEVAKQYRRPLAMHVAESPDERELLLEGTGRFSDSLKRIGVWSEGLFPWKTRGDKSPFIYLFETLRTAPTSLLIHCNDLRKDEIAFLAQNSHMSVVYCPRTHAFFGHERHPVAEMIQNKIRVAIGTDSRASNPDLSVWNEVQFLLHHRTDLAPHDVLKMATMHGADALGYSNFGRLELGCCPALIGIPTTATKVDDVYSDFAMSAVVKLWPSPLDQENENTNPLLRESPRQSQA